MFNELDPALVRWGDADVEFVIECVPGRSTLAHATAHLRGSVRRVVIAGPSPDVPTLVFGANERLYDAVSP